jgi:hypothetical protein
MALPAAAADDISFSPTITQGEFAQFSRTVSQAIFPTPVQPARATGFLGFDIGLAAVAVPIDKNASWWQHSVTNDFTTSGYLAVPRLVASKGFSFATLSASYAEKNGIKTIGGAIDIPVVRGTIATPELALRGSYATLSGVDVFHLKTYGAEAFISKGFGPLMPYAAYGRTRTDARGIVPGIPSVLPSDRTLSDKADQNRLTVGVRISMLFPKITVEATRAQVTSYAAKISFGF